jgi:hypothetical protein
MDIGDNSFSTALPAMGGQSISLADAAIEGEYPVSRSSNIDWCLYLIYYFTLCDFVLKFLPLGIAVTLRYLPEAFLFFMVALLLFRRKQILSFPLFWPLAVCAATMTVSGILNSSSPFGVASDFHSFFRFSAFTYIMWRTTITPSRIGQFVDGFLRLTILELVIGGLELAGGAGVRSFFIPAVGWSEGTPAVSSSLVMDKGSWLSGTLADYNQYGMFMALSCVLALAMYGHRQSPKYLWIGCASALAVVLSISRHSLLLLFIGIAFLLYFHRHSLLNVRNIRRFGAIAVCGLAVIGVSGSTTSVLRERIASIVSPDVVGGDPDANIRLYMTLVLTPRFLSAYPFFGQGPIAAADAVPLGSEDRSLGPQLKAAPDLPGWVTFFIGDVVWVLILGLYGCCGLAAFGFIFWTIAVIANSVRKTATVPEELALAQVCLVGVVIFFASGLFSLEMIARDTIPVFWAIAGIILSLWTSQRSRMDVSKA